jgi:hypothetical protein
VTASLRPLILPCINLSSFLEAGRKCKFPIVNAFPVLVVEPVLKQKMLNVFMVLVVEPELPKNNCRCISGPVRYYNESIDFLELTFLY